MLISFNWLKKYVSLPDSILPEEVAAKLQATTVEVESVLRPGKDLEGIVVGKIAAVEKHPNADKLKVCQVQLGNEMAAIVCGGSNVEQGMLVAVAKLGARVRWHGEGEPIVMEKATIRGVESFGMICAADEIGLAERFPKKDEREIVDLSGMNVKPGTPLAEALELNDVIFEIDNKSLSHRPDLWGHYGIAREVAVLFNREVSKYPSTKIKPGKGFTIKVAVENKDDCSRYSAVALTNLAPTVSPAWLQNALKAVGVRPVNTVVDATNYVMHDLGQPLHAFDAAVVDKNHQVKSAIKHITVRRAIGGERLVTLDGVERVLDEDMIVIADSERVLALAGVMGGLESGITFSTTAVIIESATFNPGLIRIASGRFSLRSDASMRFEKSLDPNLCAVALERVVALLLELHPAATVASGVVDHYAVVRKPQTLEIPLSLFEQKIGCVIPEKFVEQTLARLGFNVTIKKKTVVFKVPTWRGGKDIVLPEDVIEEVLRFYGYDHVAAALPVFPMTPPTIQPLNMLKRMVARMLATELGYTEVYTYSFVSGEQIKRLGDDAEKYLELDNPISKEKPFIRRTLLPNLLEALEKGSAMSDRVALFEIGSVFHADEAGVRTMEQSDELLPRQDTWLTSVYVAKKDNAPFWEARRVAELFCARTGYVCEIVPATVAPLSTWQHPARTAWLKVGEKIVGSIFELHPAVSEHSGLKDRVSVCSINLSLLSEMNLEHQEQRQYVSIPVFPEVTRDIAFVVPQTVQHDMLVGELRQADDLITKVVLFDVFAGVHVKPGHKSMAYHLTYAKRDRTLTSSEVDVAEAKVVSVLTNKFQAEIRK